MKILISLLLLTNISATATIAPKNIPSTPHIPISSIPIQPDTSIEGGSKEPAGKGLDFVSFTIGKFKDSNILSLSVPNATSGKNPQLLVQYPPKSYRWNPKLQLNAKNEFEARWESTKLRREKIQPQQLFARAEAEPQGANGDTLFLPVILDRSAGLYEFVFYCTQCEAQIKQVKVASNQQTMSCKLISDRITPKIRCDGRQAKVGRYRIAISGSWKPNGSTQTQPLSGMGYNFRHDPKWLR